MDKYVELLVGLILIVLSVYVALPHSWGGMNLSLLGIGITQAVGIVLIGGIVLGVFCFGALFLMLGIMDLRE